MSKFCSLVSDAAALDIYLLLASNKNITVDQFSEGLVDIIFQEDDVRSDIADYQIGDLTSKFGEYLKGLNAITTMTVGYLREDLDDYSNLHVRPIDLINAVGLAVKQKMEVEKSSAVSIEVAPEEPEAEVTVETTATDDETATVEGTGLKVETITQSLDLLEETSHKVGMPIEVFAKKYFNKPPGLLNLYKDFGSFFMNTVYAKMIDQTQGGTGYNGNFTEVIDAAKAEMTKLKDAAIPVLENLTLEDLPSASKEVQQAYFAMVANKQFYNVAAIFFPGVKWNSEKVVIDDTTTRRTFATYDGSFSGLDNVSDVLKMHIYTTPLLKKNDDGTYSQDKHKSHLTLSEVKMIANEINSLPADAYNFEIALSRKASQPGPAKDAFVALYNKFFNPNPYQVGDTVYNSLSTLQRNAQGTPAGDKLQDIISSFITAFRSMQNLEHVISEWGKVDVTRTKNIDVAAVLENDQRNNLFNPNNENVLNSNVQKKISVHEDVDGFYIKVGRNIKIKYDLNNHNLNRPNAGVLVNVSPESRDQLEDTATAVKALEAFGFPPYMGNKFVEFYKDNIDNYSVTGMGDVSLANMIANFAYIIAMNIPIAREKMNEFGNGFIIPPSRAEFSGSNLIYAPLDIAYSFRDILIDFAEKTEGLSVKKFRMNGDGNIVSVTGVKSRIYDTANMVAKLADTKKEGHVHQNDILVNKEYILDGWASKDGITKKGKRKGNAEMTLAEQHQYLIEDSYLKYASQNRYEKAIFQPLVMADRSMVEMAIVKKGSGSEFLPFNWDSLDMNGMRPMQKAFIKQQREFHQNYAQQILNSWNKELPKLGYPEQTSFEALVQFLKDTKIPLATIQKTDLVLQSQYVGDSYKNEAGEKIKYARIKEAFVEMYNTWNNDESAKLFTTRSFFQFKKALARDGYTESVLSDESVRLLEERFGAKNERRKLFNALITSYFYQNNMMVSSIGNLNMGSVYQFKGELDLTSVDKQIEAYRENLEKRAAEDDSLTAIEIENRLERTRRSLAMDKALNSMFVDQAKRNAGLGSGFQHPRLATEREKGFLMDYHTITALVDDPAIAVELLGKLSPDVEQEVYDAAQFGHPLYFIKLNNSLGNDNSGYISKGGAVKDISNELDPITGILRFQKKATFNQFSHELLREGTPELNRLFEKMNSVPFSDFGLQPLVTELGTFNNLQELWEAHGSINNPDSWLEVAQILGEHPAYRTAYVEKVGFKSGEKSGNRKFNTKEVWENTTTPILWTKFSNDHHGVILNADHDPDSTHTEEAEKSLMTQVISAVAFQGESRFVADQINSALETLSESGLKSILDSILEESIKILKADYKAKLVSGVQYEMLMKLWDAAAIDPEAASRLENELKASGFLDKGTKRWVQRITAEAVSKQEPFGITSDLINAGALDTMQVNSVMHRSIMSEFNRKTTRVKFKGQEFVVSASYHFNKVYSLPNGTLVNRSGYINSDLTPWEDVTTPEALAELTSYDVVQYNGVEMTLAEARKANGGTLEGITGLKAKLPKNARPLDWIKYKNRNGYTVDAKDATGNYYFKEYGDLINNTDPTRTEDLEVALMNLMADPKQGWETIDAEFFMPMMHLKYFNLDDPYNEGEAGTHYGEAISISTIMGDQTGGGDIYIKNGERIDAPEEGSTTISSQEYKHMKAFFAERIEMHGKRYGLHNFEAVSLETVNDVRILEEKIQKRLGRVEYNGLEYNYYQAQLNVLGKVLDTNIDNPIASGITEEFDALLESQKEAYIETLSEKQALSFPKTLEIIAARIPAQGKQSFVAGRVRGFITSNRNALYGAPQMLTITGADHDIDKSHVLVYSLRPDGSLFSYKNYLEDGKISKAKFEAEVAEKVKSLKEDLTTLGVDVAKIESAIKTLKKNELHSFKEATKNFVLDKLRESIRDPRNAVEAATPVSMKKLQDALEFISGGNLAIDSQDGGVIFDDNTLASPYNPASIPQLELVNSTGKQLVGVNATGLKGYAAIFTAVLKNPESPFLQFGSEIERIFSTEKVKNVPTETKQIFESYFGEDIATGEKISDNTLNLYIKGQDGSLERRYRSSIANTDRFGANEAGNENKWRQLQDSWLAEGLSQEEVDARLIEESAYLLDKKRKLEPQAWEDISELLSAATDNAKELLLGRLGITLNTNGFVVAGITLGFDLGDVLTLLRDSKVQEIIQRVEKSNDTVLGDGRFTTLEKELTDYVDKKYAYIASRIASLSSSVKIADSNIIGEVLTAESIALSTGLNSIEDATLVFSGEEFRTNANIKTATEEEEPATTAEEAELKELLGTSFSKISLPKAAAILRSLKGAYTIIVTESLSPAQHKLVTAYASSVGKPVYEMGDVRGDTGWRIYNGSEFVSTTKVPIFGRKNALVVGKTITEAKGRLLNGAIANTHLALSNPEEFDLTYEQRVKDSQAESSAAKLNLKNTLESFLGDGPRQVLTLLKAANEMRAVSAMLSINQGTPNSGWDGFNYLNKFVSAINKNVPENHPKPFTTSDVIDFINAVEAKDEVKINNIINSYEPYRAAINPFYILSQNSHYFGYIKSFMKAQELINASSFINSTVTTLMSAYGNNKTEEGWSEFNNFVHGLIIEKYFAENTTQFTINNETYNLATNKGREAFINAMPDIIAAAKFNSNTNSNVFVQSLKVDPIYDAKLNDYIRLVRTFDLNKTDESQRAIMKLGLDQLRDSGDLQQQILHDALFYYSLIINKGSRGSKSFSSLFDLDTPVYERYVAFTRDNKERLPKEIDAAISNLGAIGVSLSAPSNIKEISTRAKATFADGDILISNDVDKYDKFDKSKNVGAVIKSRETGRIFVWVDDMIDGKKALGYVPVTAKHALKSIPYTQNSEGVEGAGFQLGVTIKLNNNGETAQLYKYNYDLQAYLVKHTDGRYEHMAADQFQEYNTDMVFLKNKFGKITLEESSDSKFNRVLDDKMGKETWNTVLPAATQKLVSKGVVKYRIVTADVLPPNVEIGQTVGYTVLGMEGGQRVRIKYYGTAKSTDTEVWMGLPNTGQTNAFREGKMGIQHIVYYDTETMPEELESAGLEISGGGKKISAGASAKLINQKATAFFTSRNLNIEVNDTKLMKIKSGDRHAWFKVTNQGPLGEARNKVPNLLQQLDYANTNNGAVMLSQWIEKGSQVLYTVEPFNAKAASTNSFAEYKFLPGEATANLGGGLNFITIGSDNNTSNAKLRAKALEFGLKDDDVSSEVMSVLDEDGKHLKALVNEYSDVFEGTIKNEEINAVLKADMVVIVDDFSTEKSGGYQNKLKKSGLTLQHFSNEEKIVLEVIDKATTAEQIEALEELKEKIRTGRLGSDINAFKEVTNNTNRLLNLTNVILNKLAYESNVPKELKAATNTTPFIAQAAKHAGKPLYIYSPSRQQWFKYDVSTGDFDPTRIPVAAGAVALFNHNESNRLASVATDSLLRKTSFVRNIQLNPMNDIFTTGDLTFGETEPSEVNNVVSEDTKTILADVPNFVDFEMELNEEGTKYIGYKEIPSGEKIYESDIIEFDENTVVQQHADGAVSIKTDSYFWVYFPNQELMDKYSLEGNNTKTNFTVKIGDTNYTFDKLTRMDPDAFAYRDQLLAEKAELKRLFKEADTYGKAEVSNLYAKARYSSLDLMERHKNYGSLDSFMIHLINGGITDVDPALKDELISAYNKFKIKKEAAWDYFRKLRKDNDGNTFDYKSTPSSFFDITPTANDVLVFLTDNAGEHTFVDHRVTSAPRAYIEGRKWGQQKIEGELRSYALPIATLDRSGAKRSYTKAPQQLVNTAVLNLVKLANKETDKIFYVELPSNMGTSAYDQVTGKDAMLMINNAFRSVKGSIPKNIIFTNGGIKSMGVSRTVPFTITDDATDLNTKNLDYMSLWSAKIGDKTVAQLWNIERGYPEDVNAKKDGIGITAPALKGSDAAGMDLQVSYKNLWRRWAEANPKKFERLAVSIKNKSIYDPFNGGGEVSMTRALVELMTEAFIDNSWLNYPKAEIEGTLNEGQTILPLAGFGLVNFTSKVRGGKAMITINGKTYIGTIDKMAAKSEERHNVSFLEKLGLANEDNPVKVAEAQYPFIKEQNFVIVSLAEFNGEIKAVRTQKEGYYSDAIEKAGLEVSAEHMILAKKATATLGIDTRSRITNTIDASMTGTDRIKNMKAVLGDGLFVDPTLFDAIWIYGSTLAEGNNPEVISGVVQSTKVLIDRYLKAGSEILIGHENGIEEEIRAYIAANYSDYIETETGFVKGKYQQPEYNVEIGTNGNLFRLGADVARFNENNTQEREGDNLTGAWGTILHTTEESAADTKNGKGKMSAYQTTLKSTEIVSWNAIMSTDELLSLVEQLSLEVVPTNTFEAIRGNLLVTEQRYVRHLIGASLAVKYNISTADLDNAAALDVLVGTIVDKNSKSYDPNFADDYNRMYAKMFNEDGSFRVSDVGSLAMARNRAITNSYAKELLPELFNDNFEAHPVFNFINAERSSMDSGKGYFELLNSTTISENTMRLITESKGITYRDGYNLLKTLGPDKIITKGSAISGNLINKMFVQVGIKAFKDGEKIVVLDNSTILRKPGGKYDQNTGKSESKLLDIEIELAQTNSAVYRYLKMKNMIKFDPYAAQMRVIFGEDLRRYNAGKDGIEELIRDTRVEIAYSYFKNLQGVEFTKDYIATILRNKDFGLISGLVNSHMKGKRSLVSDNFSRFFFGEAKENLPTRPSDLIPGAVYTGIDGAKNFVMKDSEDQWFAQSSTGDLFYLIGSIWKKAEGINNQITSFEASLVNTIASPKGIGKTYRYLVLPGSEQISGEFEVSRQVFTEGTLTLTEITAEDHTSGEMYRWEPVINAWAHMKSPSFAQTQATADANPEPGATVLALPLVGGNNIVLLNGVALTETLVKDDKGEYSKDDTGLWVQTKILGGFQNTDVKFQKETVEFVDVDGRRLASKTISNEAMRTVFDKIFKSSNTPAELLTAADIETKYGVNYSNAAGFVIDGKIVINLDKATLDTPLHEFGGHIYMSNLKATNLEAYATIVEQCLAHPMAAKLKLTYPELNQEDLGEEVFSTLFGLTNQEKLNEQSLTKWQKIKNLANSVSNIKDFFRGLFKIAFGTDMDFELDLNDSLTDIMNKLGDDIIFGRQSTFNNLTAKEQQLVKDAKQAVRSEADIEQRLKDLGFIQIICN